MMPQSDFPWDRVLSAGVRHGLSLEACWSMTPAELMCLFASDEQSDKALTKQQLQMLMTSYPDEIFDKDA